MCEDLLNNSPVGQDHEHRMFFWENLGSYTSSVIYQTVEASCGRIIMSRPAYKPANGPIEYAFFQLADRLRDRCHIIRDLHRVVNPINCIISQLCGFGATIDYVGYKSNQ